MITWFAHLTYQSYMYFLLFFKRKFDDFPVKIVKFTLQQIVIQYIMK